MPQEITRINPETGQAYQIQMEKSNETADEKILDRKSKCGRVNC